MARSKSLRDLEGVVASAHVDERRGSGRGRLGTPPPKNRKDDKALEGVVASVHVYIRAPNTRSLRYSSQQSEPSRGVASLRIHRNTSEVASTL
ncbi:hypothetical protein Taro_048845 [Colocasia esculenta]|uniref:Uncharacterized protein n=1 Tax=Colocasia esculenta TaxID=4460 RepID=A0A843X982_COLES|nr:hypothetical protein [Colocasia esculenta]